MVGELDCTAEDPVETEQEEHLGIDLQVVHNLHCRKLGSGAAHIVNIAEKHTEVRHQMTHFAVDPIVDLVGNCLVDR
jgi:hypothetical protein